MEETLWKFESSRPHHPKGEHVKETDQEENTLDQEALLYHAHPTPGKFEITPTKPLKTQKDLSLAYSPGVAAASTAIARNADTAFELTGRGNLVGIISNGTAVLGLGNIGPLASKPVMEGKAVLFKKFAGINVFDIELNATDPLKMAEHIAAIAPTFGGINLEDIKAPECFEVEALLKERLSIPIFHDDQHGTAIVVTAAMQNGLSLAGKRLEDIKLVVSGAGAAAIACLKLLTAYGLPANNIWVFDSHGLITRDRTDLDSHKAAFAQNGGACTLKEALHDADVFLGLSAAGVLSADMVQPMAKDPLIFGLANPTPEIMPEVAQKARPDAILATGRSDYPNQVNNVLCFPYIFRGALDVGATAINDAMKKACVQAICDLAKEAPTETVKKAYAGDIHAFGPLHILPKPFDERLLTRLAPSVAKAAMETGVATRPIKDWDAYGAKLHRFC